MPTPGERIIDEAIRHRIALGRYSNATVRKVMAQLARVDADLVARIARAEGEGASPLQLERLLDEVRALQTDGWEVLRGRLGDDLADLAEAERDFAARMVRFGRQSSGLAVATNIPSTAQVVAAVNARPFQGRFLRGWMAEAEEGAKRRVREALRQGFIEGRSAAELVRQIRGTRALGYRDGILEVSRRGAEAMVRTAITHTSAAASNTTYEALGVETVRFIATLDSRTTLTCAGLHNRTFPRERFPWPPRHVNCRSVAAPVVEGVDAAEAPSYDEWLRRQPDAVQDDILGATRAALFRSGALTVDRFTDGAGKTLSLAALRRQSGLDPEPRITTSAGRMTAGELAAVASYTGQGSAAINETLRGQRRPTGKVRDEIARLDDLLARSRMAERETVYRGVGPALLEAFRRAGLGAGSVIIDPAFVSTSLSREIAEGFLQRAGIPGGYLLVIGLPPRSRALRVEKVSSTGAHEREILLARGSRLKVVGYDNETRTIYAELLP